MRAARTFALALACGIAGGAPLGIANAADAPGPNTDAACVKPFFATLDGNANAVVVRVVDLGGPFTGTITAYGADRTWSATIERAALIELPYGGSEASVTVRADGPIAGIAYAPAWTTCVFRAGTRSARDYDAPDVQRPILPLGDPHAIAPVTCANPYAAPTVKHAIEPNTPVDVYARGTVKVAVAIDERGIARFARVVESPAAEINASAANAARRSEYSPGTFRCEPVPSSYQFNVGYF
jgi:TonB-like protein